MVRPHKEVVGVKNIFFKKSVSTLIKPLIEREWFKVEKFVAQKQDKDLPLAALLQSRDSTWGNISDILPFFPHPSERVQVTIYTLLVMVGVATLLLSSVASFVFYL